MMRLKKLLFLCFVPVFLALAFIGVPPPFLQAPRPQQQEQGDGVKKGELRNAAAVVVYRK